MLRTTLFGIATLACLFPSSLFAQTSVGWNYVGVSGQGSLNPADIAGAPGFAQANWNNHVQAAFQAPGATPLLNLGDQFGATTSVDVTAWTTTPNNSWTLAGGPVVDPSARLTADFNSNNASITFADLGSEFTDNGYSVVVYYGNNEGPATSDLTIDGVIDDLITKSITTGNTAAWYANAGWLEEVPGDGGAPTNFTVFSGLDDPSFTLSIATPSGNQNNGISALQIVANAAVPEPAAITLWLLLAGVLLAAGRRFATRRIC
jgi:hypothetical protein